MEHPIIAKREVTRYILSTFGLRAKKKLGQNFLVGEELVASIAAQANLTPADTVLEIGPGIGTLTQALAETGAQVKAVELDTHLIPVLAKTLEGYDNVTVINADILKTDIKALVGNKPFALVANLPYYITTPIIFALLEQKLPLTKLVMMVQKEVAERLVAQPGTKDYGSLTIDLQYYMETEIALHVPASAFIPSPKVDSAIVVCTPRDRALVTVKEEVFFPVVKAAFSVRRKMLSNALRNIGLNGDQVNQWLAKAGIDGKRRGETLTIQEYAKLSNIYEEMFL
jgi:16S rRNA (adenine1518-N6/adenine1519-N6)-dimethyltransferase